MICRRRRRFKWSGSADIGSRSGRGAGDVVHVHSLRLAELGMELARRFGLKLLYTAHSLMHVELATNPG